MLVRFSGPSYIADQLVGKAHASIKITTTTPTSYNNFSITTQPNKVAKL